MSDDSNNKAGGWLDDEDSGLYGGTESWLDEDKPERPEPARTIGHMRLPEREEPAADPDEPQITDALVANEPEEERTDWNETSYAAPKEKVKIEGISSEETEEKKTGFSFGAFAHKKTLLMAAAGALCALLIFGIVLAVSRAGGAGGEKEPEEQAVVPEETVIPTEEVGITEVIHLSFPQLSMEHITDFVSVKEFSQILTTLYENDYVLIDVYDLADVDENGNYSLKKTIDVPEGKKPLLLSAQDVSYPLNRQGADFARKLVVDGDGFIHNEYVNADGMAEMGDFDVIPLVDSFVREHPDFSYNGAKGIIGLTGYNGILGYRTSYYPETGENPYGTIDMEAEKQSAGIVIDALKNSGWRFASNGYGNISYGSEYSMIEADAAAWTEKVGSLVGATDLLLLPRDTDIGSWAPYTQDNPKYTLLWNTGYRYFFIDETETPGFLQVESQYVRQAITKITTFSQFRDLFEE